MGVRKRYFRYISYMVCIMVFLTGVLSPQQASAEEFVGIQHDKFQVSSSPVDVSPLAYYVGRVARTMGE